MGKILRRIGLGVLIVSDLACIILMFVAGNTIWAIFFTAVTCLVVGFEGYAILTEKKTISTKYKEFIQKNPVAGYAGIALFTLAMLGLALHLSVW